MYMERGQRYIVEHQKHTVSIYIYIYRERYISARQPAPTNNTHTHSPTHAQIYIDLCM